MATTTEHYGMTIPTGSDIVNPLVDTFPNFETIDGQMFANENATVGTATEIKTGNVHALTRDNGNNNTFRFVATSVFNSGDSFTVDGVSVTAVLPSGESLGDSAYVIGSNVLCILTSTQLTVFTNGGTASNSLALNGQSASYYLNSANSSFDNTGTGISATNTEGAIKEIGTYSKINITQQDISNITLTSGQISYCYLEKRGKVCTFQIDGTNTNTTSQQTIFILPDGYKPKSPVRISFHPYTHITNNVNFLEITNDTITFYSNTDSRYFIRVVYNCV